jgi:hypothetical protein
MGYVQLVLNNRKKIQTPTPSAPTALLDLPGFKRHANLLASQLECSRKEYDLALIERRNLNKKLKSATGDRKKELKVELDRLKELMDKLLSTTGTYTTHQKVYGFGGGGHDF